MANIKQDFINKWYAVAEMVSQRLSVPVDAILGQWAQETGWGKSVISGTGYNIANIKAGAGWKGKSIQAYDAREKSNDFYRVYSTPTDFANDYINLIGANRFKKAIGSTSAFEFFTRLQSGNLKYATSPTYVRDATATANSVKQEMIKMGLQEDAPTGLKKWLLNLPISKLFGAGVVGSNTVINQGGSIADGVSDAAGYASDINLVGGIGNFALRAVVILSAVALIAIGFYFMFKNEIVNTAKGII